MAYDELEELKKKLAALPEKELSLEEKLKNLPVKENLPTKTTGFSKSIPEEAPPETISESDSILNRNPSLSYSPLGKVLGAFDEITRKASNAWNRPPDVLEDAQHRIDPNSPGVSWYERLGIQTAHLNDAQTREYLESKGYKAKKFNGSWAVYDKDSNTWKYIDPRTSISTDQSLSDTILEPVQMAVDYVPGLATRLPGTGALVAGVDSWLRDELGRVLAPKNAPGYGESVNRAVTSAAIGGAGNYIGGKIAAGQGEIKKASALVDGLEGMKDKDTAGRIKEVVNQLINSPEAIFKQAGGSSELLMKNGVAKREALETIERLKNDPDFQKYIIGSMAGNEAKYQGIVNKKDGILTQLGEALSTAYDDVGLVTRGDIEGAKYTKGAGGVPYQELETLANDATKGMVETRQVGKAVKAKMDQSLVDAVLQEMPKAQQNIDTVLTKMGVDLEQFNTAVKARANTMFKDWADKNPYVTKEEGIKAWADTMKAAENAEFSQIYLREQPLDAKIIWNLKKDADDRAYRESLSGGGDGKADEANKLVADSLRQALDEKVAQLPDPLEREEIQKNLQRYRDWSTFAKIIEPGGRKELMQNKSLLRWWPGSLNSALRRGLMVTEKILDTKFARGAIGGIDNAMKNSKTLQLGGQALGAAANMAPTMIKGKFYDATQQLGREYWDKSQPEMSESNSPVVRGNPNSPFRAGRPASGFGGSMGGYEEPEAPPQPFDAPVERDSAAIMADPENFASRVGVLTAKKVSDTIGDHMAQAPEEGERLVLQAAEKARNDALMILKSGDPIRTREALTALGNMLPELYQTNPGQYPSQIDDTIDATQDGQKHADVTLKAMKGGLLDSVKAVQQILELNNNPVARLIFNPQSMTKGELANPLMASREQPGLQDDLLEQILSRRQRSPQQLLAEPRQSLADQDY